MTHSCPIRRVVDEAITTLTVTEDPTLLSELGTFLHGQCQRDEAEPTSDGFTNLPSLDPMLLSCGFIPVAIVTDGLVAGGDVMFSPQHFSREIKTSSSIRKPNDDLSSRREDRHALLESGSPTNCNAYSTRSLAESFSAILHVSSDSDVGPFIHSVMNIVKDLTKKHASLKQKTSELNLRETLTRGVNNSFISEKRKLVESGTASLLIVCRCTDGSAMGGAGASNLSAKGSTSLGGSLAGNAAAVRKIALSLAQTVTRVVIGAEGAASVGRALSYALVGDERSCPMVSVLITAASDNTSIPNAIPMIRQQCRGSYLKIFTSEQQHAVSSPEISNSSYPSALIPLPVAQFLYKVIPSIPVVLSKEGLSKILQAWYASLRLSDVGAMFVALVMPFNHLRAYAAQVEADGAADKKSTAAQTIEKDMSRAGQFIANIPLIQALVDHCTVLACTSDTDIGPSRAFGVLYGNICCELWDSVRRTTLFRIIDAHSTAASGMDVVGQCSEEDVGLGDNERNLPCLPKSPTPTVSFGYLQGSTFVARYQQSIVPLDISHVTLFSPTYPTYFPALAGPNVSFSHDLVKNLLNKVSIVVGCQQEDAHEETQADYTDPTASKKRRTEGAKGAGGSLNKGTEEDEEVSFGTSAFLDQASKFLEDKVSNTNNTAAATHKPTMAFSKDFYSSAISDAVRVLYVLVCRELQGGQMVWVPLAQLCLLSCFGDELRCLRALHHLGMCRVVVVRPGKAFSSLQIDEGILRRALGAMGYGNVSEEEMLRVGHRLLEMDAQEDVQAEEATYRTQDKEAYTYEDDDAEDEEVEAGNHPPESEQNPQQRMEHDEFEDQFMDQHQMHLQNNTSIHSQAEGHYPELPSNGNHTAQNTHSEHNQSPSRQAIGSAFRRVLPPPPLPPHPQKLHHKATADSPHHTHEQLEAGQPSASYYDPSSCADWVQPPKKAASRSGPTKSNITKKRRDELEGSNGARSGTDTPLSNFINAKGEYRHQQRFKPYIGLEAKLASLDVTQRHHDQQLTAGTFGQNKEDKSAAPNVNPRPHTSSGALKLNRSSSVAEKVRPGSAKTALRGSSGVRLPLGPLSSNESQLYPHAFLSTHASNVIYAYTDNANYRSAGIVGRAPFVQKKRPQTDVVAKGRAMREAWSRDGFLTQKNRKEERWEVRRSMVSVPPQ